MSAIAVTQTRVLNVTRTQRDLQVSFLRQLDRMMQAGQCTHEKWFGFCTPDTTHIFAVDLGDKARSDWLATLVNETTDEPITGFALGFIPFFPVTFSAGLTAAGAMESTTLVAGCPVDSGMASEMTEHLIRQARLLWGDAWSPTP